MVEPNESSHSSILAGPDLELANGLFGGLLLLSAK